MSVTADLATFVELWDLTGDLATYATAIGQMFAEVESYAADTDTTVGWQALWDVDLAPHNALPWLAMIVGERVQAGSTDAQARALIKAAPNQDRGTPQAIANAVKQLLTGAQTVGMRERTTDAGVPDDDALNIVTWSSQTPNANAVDAALRRSVPADIDVYYQVLSSPTWATIQSGSPTWATIQSTDGPTWADIDSTTSLAGYVVY